MTQKGEHTWDLYQDYHSCPKCGKIIESRQDYENRFGEYIKELNCPRCNNHFTIKKDQKFAFGPLTGDPQPIEMDWDSNKL